MRARPKKLATSSVCASVSDVQLFWFEFMNVHGESFLLAEILIKIQQVESNKGCAQIATQSCCERVGDVKMLELFFCVFVLVLQIRYSSKSYRPLAFPRGNQTTLRLAQSEFNKQMHTAQPEGADVRTKTNGRMLYKDNTNSTSGQLHETN